VTLCERRVATALWVVALLAIAGSSRAEDKQTFEARRVEGALAAGGYQRDPAPHGKRVAFIRIVREEVFVGEELLLPIVLPKAAPTWPNTFHWLTEESVVRRELLVQEGQLYSADLIAESERNLRALGILALARIEAVRTDKPDEVGLMVFTRDLWSLRLETGFAGAGESYGLTTQLIERNMFGRDKQLAVRWDGDVFAWSVGQVYIDGRVANQKLTLVQSFDVIFNHASGEAEGSQGHVTFGRPFYDLKQQFSWNVAAGYSVSVIRRLRGAELSYVRRIDDKLRRCEAGEDSCYGYTWDQRRGGASAAASYRIGQLYKQTFSLELGFSDAIVRPTEETLVDSGPDGEARRDILPRVRRQAYPKLSYSLWLPRYAVLENLSTFGQSESVREGPELSASFAVPIEAFGSSSDSFVFSAGAGFVWSEANALLEASLGAGTRLEDGRAGDQRLSVLTRGATPPWLLGRLVGIFSYLGQRRDTDNTLVTLGGDNGLRGYDANELFAEGGTRFRASAEYRSLPLELSSVHVGGVLFYDAGTVYNSLEDAKLEHSIGAGVRVLFPQFNRYPFRFDVGVPLDGGFAMGVGFGSDQAVPLTATDDALGYVAVRPQ
jgi:hypothetical protein